MAAKKPSPAIPEPSDQPFATSPDATQFRILKKAQCPTISGKSDLTYNIACDPQKAIYLRVASNSGGGFFSQEWVALKDIQKALSAGSPISAIRLMPLFRGQSVNTPGFLLAVLAAENLIRPLPGKQRVHELVQNGPTSRPGWTSSLPRTPTCPMTQLRPHPSCRPSLRPSRLTSPSASLDAHPPRSPPAKQHRPPLPVRLSNARLLPAQADFPSRCRTLSRKSLPRLREA